MAGGRRKLKSAEVLDVLSSLVDKSLVLVDDTPTGQRYRLLETVREYLHETYGESAEAKKCRTLHRSYYLNLAESIDTGITHGIGSFERLAHDHDNLRAAYDIALAEAPIESLRIVSAMSRYWRTHGHLLEGSERTREALLRNEQSRNTPEFGEALLSLGTLLWLLGDFQNADDVATEALEACESHGSQANVAYCLQVLGNIQVDRSDLMQARKFYERSLSIFRDLKVHLGVGGTLNNLGGICMYLGDTQGAKQYYEEALRLSTPGSFGRGTRLGNLAEAYCSAGDHAKAVELFQEAMEANRGLGDAHAESVCLAGLGFAEACRGEFNEAREVIEKAIHRSELTDDERLFSQGHIYLSFVFLQMAAIDEARSHLERGLGDHAVLSRMLLPEELVLAGAVFSDPRMWGAVQAWRHTKGIVPVPNERMQFDRHYARVRKEMGDDAFDAAWKEGERMTMDEAVALVLGS